MQKVSLVFWTDVGKHFCNCSNFHCCKWRNDEQKSVHLFTLMHRDDMGKCENYGPSQITPSAIALNNKASKEMRWDDAKWICCTFLILPPRVQIPEPSNDILFNMGQTQSLCVYFILFHNKMTNKIWLKIGKSIGRWCAWDSNPRPLNGRRRRTHWAMATPLW